MQNNKDIQILNKQTIESMIYTIRGQKVMSDFDLARIYGYSTKEFNQQVQRNIYKIPERYRFQISKVEINTFSRSQNATLKKERGKNYKYMPYSFTEQGIYMLMTVLKGGKI